MLHKDGVNGTLFRTLQTGQSDDDLGTAAISSWRTAAAMNPLPADAVYSDQNLESFANVCISLSAWNATFDSCTSYVAPATQYPLLYKRRVGTHLSLLAKFIDWLSNNRSSLGPIPSTVHRLKIFSILESG